RKLALQVGKLFGLDIYGLDVVETPQGPAILDINDFPSFGRVPRAVMRISEYVLHAAKRAEMQRAHRRSRSYKGHSMPASPAITSEKALVSSSMLEEQKQAENLAECVSE
ncbi:MAG TPA: hypothetical protein VGT44_15670, partial [Ktedonobacteraceae bacterium]|nr:hypothetical protein [Ktedonobacteraceae bacterium]